MGATRIVEVALDVGRCDQRALFNGAARIVHIDVTQDITAFVRVFGEPTTAEGLRNFYQTELVFRFVKSGEPVYGKWQYGGTVCDRTGALHVFYMKRTVKMVAVDCSRSPEYPPL